MLDRSIKKTDIENYLDENEKKANACIIVKILSYIYEICPELITSRESFYTNISNTIKYIGLYEGGSSREFEYVYMYVFKLLYLILT